MGQDPITPVVPQPPQPLQPEQPVFTTDIPEDIQAPSTDITVAIAQQMPHSEPIPSVAPVASAAFVPTLPVAPVAPIAPVESVPPVPPVSIAPVAAPISAPISASVPMDINSMLGSLGSKMDETIPSQPTLDQIASSTQETPVPVMLAAPEATPKKSSGLVVLLLMILVAVGGYFYLSTTRPLLLETWTQQAMTLLGVGSTGEVATVPLVATGDTLLSGDVPTPLADSLASGDQYTGEAITAPVVTTGVLTETTSGDTASTDAVLADVFGSLDETLQTDDEKITEYMFIIDDLEIQTKALAETAERTQDKKTHSIAQAILNTIGKVREDMTATSSVDVTTLGNSVTELQSLFQKIQTTEDSSGDSSSVEPTTTDSATTGEIQ